MKHFLGDLRHGKPLIRYPLDYRVFKWVTNGSCTARPLTRGGALDWQRSNPDYWQKHVYPQHHTAELLPVDIIWNTPHLIEDQGGPRGSSNRIRRGSDGGRRRRSISPEYDVRRRPRNASREGRHGRYRSRSQSPSRSRRRYHDYRRYSRSPSRNSGSYDRAQYGVQYGMPAELPLILSTGQSQGAINGQSLFVPLTNSVQNMQPALPMQPPTGPRAQIQGQTQKLWSMPSDTATTQNQPHIPQVVYGMEIGGPPFGGTTMACTICGAAGHDAGHCPSDYPCALCNKKGHKAFECSRKR